MRKGGRRLRILICIFYGAKGVKGRVGGAKGIEGCAKEVVFLHLYLNCTWCEGCARKVQRGSEGSAKGVRR